MTDSPSARVGKRERLIAGAAELLHQRGVGATSLAHIAQAAEVPLGNVYYYFKTKDDLVRAVIAAQLEQVDAMLDALDDLPQPAERLSALVRRWEQMREVIARYGCPFGTLAAELGRRPHDDLHAEEPIRRILEWIEVQMCQLGAHNANESATALFAGVQGGALLANSLHDPDVMSSQVRHLQQWIEAIALTQRQP